MQHFCPSLAARSVKAAAILALALGSSPRASLALPINFNHNQGDLDYAETRDDNYIVYHDRRTKAEGALILNALRQGHPVLQSWFGVRRKAVMPVVVTPIGTGASFANIVTDAMELQTGTWGDADLVWHEAVHMTMYQHYHNILGPAGALLHVAWMPAWWIEGLAEALSVSVRSDVTAGIERYQALTGDWPTYDSLHQLYGVEHFSTRGYATAGGLVSYLLRRLAGPDLVTLHQDFRDYTMPWWWPWATVPFNGFMPFDRSLEQRVGLSGESAYSQYQRDAERHWQKAQSGRLLVGEPGPRQAVRLSPNLSQQHIDYIDETGWVVGLRTGAPTGQPSWTRPGGARFWIESGFSRRQLCAQAAAGGPKTCSAALSLPLEWHHLGTETGLDGLPTTAWLGLRHHKLPHDEWQLWRWDLTTQPDRVEVKQVPWPASWVPVNVGWHRRGAAEGAAPADIQERGTWVLLADHRGRRLVSIDDGGRCLGELAIADHITQMVQIDDDRLALELFAGNESVGRVVRPSVGFDYRPCTPYRAPTSPLREALAIMGTFTDRSTEATSPSSAPPLQEAFAAADPWSLTTRTDLAPVPTTHDDLEPTGTSLTTLPADATTADDAAWRARPVVAVPWIGADDALGSHYGIMSVPLMDHMQNHTIRLTALYGFESRFPHLDLSYQNTRWRPTLTLDAFRFQTFNGLFLTPDQTIIASYMDERGIKLGATMSVGRHWAWDAGAKVSTLRPFLGPSNVRSGTLFEPYWALRHSVRLASWTISSEVSGRIAPALPNHAFDYDALSFSTTTSRPTTWPFMSTWVLGLEGGRTRGPKRREHQELYRPLRTYVPGAGGGYNQNSFPVLGHGSLFGARQGDTQARAKANWIVPLIREVDRQVWILYLDRLDFTTFVNYGGAWREPAPWPTSAQRILAHGYNLDLQLENKGVRFNIGLGTGQVVGDGFQIYLTTGFDALF